MATETFDPTPAPPLAPAPSGDGSTTAERTGLGPMFDGIQKKSAARAAAAAPPEAAPTKTGNEGAAPESTPATIPETPDAEKAEAKTETPPAIPSGDPAEADAEFLKVAREQAANPHLTKRQNRAWIKFVEEHDAHKKSKESWVAERTKLAQERDEAVRKAAAAADYEEVKKARLEAEAKVAQLSAVVDAENDENFLKKYSDRASTFTADIEATLREIGVPEKAYKFLDDSDGMEKEGVSLELLKNHGGLVEFAKKNPPVYRQLLARLDDLNPIAADTIRRSVGNLSALEREKAREIAAIRANPKQFTEGKQKEVEAQKLRMAQQRDADATALEKLRSAEFARHDAFKIEPVPEKATVEEKTRIEARNKNADKYRNNLAQIHSELFMGKATVNGLTEGALRAVLYEAEHDGRVSAEARVKELEAENARLRKGGLIKPAGTITPASPSSRQVSVPVKEVVGEKALAASVLDMAAGLGRDRAQRESGNLS